MKTYQVFLSDTHFGIKNNSLTWLESQLNFFKKDVIPTLKKLSNKGDRLSFVHCGDLFDSKSSLNVLVWKTVEKLLCDEICPLCDDVFILAGNHDCYSNTEQEYNVNSLDTLKGKDDNLTIIDNYSLLIDRDDKKIALMPWFDFHNIDKLKDIVKNRPEIIFTHTDLEHLSSEIRSLTDGITIVSGHIHYPFILNENYCLGSCYAQTFADSNTERGFWVTEDWDLSKMIFVPNNSSIKFWRFHDEDIFELADKMNDSDNIEIYIDKDLLKQEDVAKQISKINEKFNRPKIIPTENNVEVTESKSLSSELFDIKVLIQNEIPENLQEKFKIIVEKYNLK